MSKLNPVHLWRFGRTRALFLPQKSLNRAKTGVLNRTPKFFPWPGQGVLTMHKTQLARINWKIKSICYGLATRGLYFLKKSDAKRPFSPPCRNWPICGVYGELWPKLYLCICIFAFACQTPGTIVFEVLIPRAFQKYSICLPFLAIFYAMCKFVFLYIWGLCKYGFCVNLGLCKSVFV